MGLQERRMIRDLTGKSFPEREKEITGIRSGTVRYEADWESLANAAGALRFLHNLSCHRLNMALRTIPTDALRDGLKAIKLGNVTDGMFNDREIYRTLVGGL